MDKLPDLRDKKIINEMRRQLIEHLRQSFPCKKLERSRFESIFSDEKMMQVMTLLFLESLIGVESAYIGAFNNGACSLVQKIVQMSSLFQKSQCKVNLLNCFFVFDEIKKCKTGEGEVPTGSSIILISDICKTGKNFLNKVQRMESLGLKVEAARILCDFEEGGIDMLSGYLCNAEAIFSLNDF